MNGGRQAAASASFPNALFVDQSNNQILQPYVNISEVLTSNAYVPLGDGLYRDQIGNIGRFHCLLCHQNDCNPAESRFQSLGMNNYFAHLRHHGCPCESGMQHRQPNPNRRVLSWRFSFLGGPEGGTVAGIPNHRVVCYLPMPDCVEADQRADFKQRLRQAITEEWEGQHFIPIVADDPLLHLPEQYEELADWLGTEDCPYAIMGYLSEPNLPRSVRFDFQGYQFNLVNRRTDVWNQDVMFFQERDHDLMFNYGQDTREYSLIEPKRIRQGQESCLLFSVDSVHRNRLILSINNINLGQPHRLETNLYGPLRFFQDSGRFLQETSRWIDGLDGVDRVIMMPANFERPNLHAIPGMDDYNHIWIQPPNSGPWAMELLAYGADNVECDGEELHFQTDAYSAVHGNLCQLHFPANNTPSSMVHYLQIHGLGTLYLNSGGRRQSMEIQVNGGQNLLEHRNTHQPETFGEVAELICAVSPNAFEAYIPPDVLLDEPFNVIGQADLHRQVVYTQVSNPEASCTTHLLTRMQNQIDMLIRTEEISDLSDGAYLMLEELGEITYGDWSEDEPELEDNNRAVNLIGANENAFYQPEGSQWAFVFSHLPASVLSDLLQCPIGLSRIPAGQDMDEIVLLSTGHRLAPAVRLEHAGFCRLGAFPRLGMLPQDPYHLVRSCFCDDERDGEMGTYDRLSQNIPLMQSIGVSWHGFRPHCAEGYGRITRGHLDRFTRSTQWQDMHVFPSEITELIDDEGHRVSVVAVSQPLEYADPHTNMEHWVGLYGILDEGEGSKRATRLFDSSDAGIVPLPWRVYYEGLANGKSKTFLRYEALNSVLLAFSACVSYHPPESPQEGELFSVLTSFLESLMPVGSRRMLSDLEFHEELDNVEQGLSRRFCSELRSSLWLGQD